MSPESAAPSPPPPTSRALFGMRWWLALAFAVVAGLTALAVVAVLSNRSESAFRRYAQEFAVGNTVAATEALKRVGSLDERPRPPRGAPHHPRRPPLHLRPRRRVGVRRRPRDPRRPRRRGRRLLAAARALAAARHRPPRVPAVGAPRVRRRRSARPADREPDRAAARPH